MSGQQEIAGRCAPSHRVATVGRFRTIAREEGRDVARFSMGAALVALVWIVFLGLRPGRLVAAEDLVQAEWPAMAELLRVGGDPSRWVYRATWLGGARFHETAGVPPLARLGALLHLSPADTINLGLLLSQAAIAFFAVIAVEALVASWREDDTPLPWWLAALVGPIAAFAPMFGVRLRGGHVSVIASQLVLLCALACLLVVRRGHRPTLVTLALTALTVRFAVTTSFGMQQMVLYTASFGVILLLPLVVAIVRSRSRDALAAPALSLVGGMALGWPAFATMLAAARSADAPRAIGGEVLTWSWITTNGRDLIAMLTSGGEIFVARDGPGMFHETQLPLGLALAALVLFPVRRERASIGALGALLAVSLAFAMRIEPVASWIVAVVPPLGAFRVPGRVLLLFGTAVTVFACAAVAYHALDARPSSLVGRLGALAVLLAVAVVPGPLGEGLGLAAVLSLVLLARRAVPVPPWLLPGAIAIASVASFARMLPAPIEERALEEHVRRGRAFVPPAANALERAWLDDPWVGGPNPYAAGGVSLAFGYWYPTRRSLELWSAAHELPVYSANHVFPPLAADNAGTRALMMLYDVRTWVRRSGEVSHPPTIGPAWFPLRVARAESMNALGALLRGRSVDGLRDEALVGPHDAVPTIDSTCGAATAAIAATPDGGQRIEVDVASPGDCLLVLSANWTSRHRGTLVAAGTAREVPLVPVYGSLIGVRLPAGTGRLIVEPIVPKPSALGMPLALLSLGLAALLRITGSARPPSR